MVILIILKKLKKIKVIDRNENTLKNNLTISKMKNDEKLKLQLFYSKYLNKYK